jgi:hypothetical protein
MGRTRHPQAKRQKKNREERAAAGPQPESITPRWNNTLEALHLSPANDHVFALLGGSAKPELLHPETEALKSTRPTGSSDLRETCKAKPTMVSR